VERSGMEVALGRAKYVGQISTHLLYFSAK